MASRKYRNVSGLLLFFLLGFIAFPDPSPGAPTNGTRFPPKGAIEAGYEYHNLLKRDLAGEFGRIKTQNHFYFFSYGLTDRLSIDLKAGLGNADHEESRDLPDLDYAAGFAGGYGFRVRAFRISQGDIDLIVGGQHISVHPRDIDLGGKHYESFLDDWQLSFVTAKSFSSATIYAGGKFSDLESVYKVDKKNKKRRFSRDHIGLVAGVDAYFHEGTVRLNLEGRFIDETGFSAAVGYLF